MAFDFSTVQYSVSFIVFILIYFTLIKGSVDEENNED